MKQTSSFSIVMRNSLLFDTLKNQVGASTQALKGFEHASKHYRAINCRIYIFGITRHKQLSKQLEKNKKKLLPTKKYIMYSIMASSPLVQVNKLPNFISITGKII